VSVLELMARLLLAAVFAVAGAAKLDDHRGTVAAVAGFGVPQQRAPLVAVVVPLAELAAVALLLIPATAWVGALLALVLLAVFSVAIAVNLGRGNTPDCHCFGSLRAEPIGVGTLVRNIAFAVPAVFLVLVA
jgi:uncharacterized membrane protein YphA (DoxX/SURF4 family)